MIIFNFYFLFLCPRRVERIAFGCCWASWTRRVFRSIDSRRTSCAKQSHTSRGRRMRLRLSGAPSALWRRPFPTFLPALLRSLSARHLPARRPIWMRPVSSRAGCSTDRQSPGRLHSRSRSAIANCSSSHASTQRSPASLCSDIFYSDVCDTPELLFKKHDFCFYS